MPWLEMCIERLPKDMPKDRVITALAFLSCDTKWWLCFVPETASDPEVSPAVACALSAAPRTISCSLEVS